MTVGQRLARLITDAAVRWPRLWPALRPVMTRQFETLAPQWDSMSTAETLAPFRAALEAVDPGPQDVLDVGTGTGAGAAAIAERFPDARIAGVDLSRAMLERARAKLPSARFERADASSLPFASESFDLVTHANMIPFFDEVSRVLRPRGYALFAFSRGAETPIHVSAQRLREELERRGFAEFAEFAAGNGTALLARKQ